MANPAGLEKLTGIASRFAAFIAERHPFALTDALEAFEAVIGDREPSDEAALEALRPAFHRELTRRLQQRPVPPGLPEPTPRMTAEDRLRQAYEHLLDDCDGFLRRAAIQTSLTPEERVEI